MADGLYEIHQITGRRVTKSGKEEYLVHWKNYDYLNRTWEPIENLKSCLTSVTGFMAKAFPMPGVTANQVVHLPAKSRSLIRKSMSVTDINTRKLRSLLGSSELVHEILKEKSKNLAEKKRHKRGKKRKLNEDLTCESPEIPQETPEETTTLNGRRMSCSAVDTNPKIVKRRRRQSSWGSPRSLARLIRQTSIQLSRPPGVKEAAQVDKLEERPIRATRTQGGMDECVSVVKESTVWKVTLCNDKKQNVLTIEMCEQLTSILHEATKAAISVVMVTGAGDHFCSGLDYSFLINNPHYKADAKKMVEKFKHLVQMFIMCPKPIVAAVNGNASGFGAALLGLCDVVYATSKATFQFCFTKWGHPPIGCSSFLLARLLGQTGACSMLLLNNKMGATEAWENGLVMDTMKGGNFMEQVNKRLKLMTAGTAKVLQDTKTLLRENDQQTLGQVNDNECKMLLQYLSDGKFVASLETKWMEDILK